MPYFATSNAHKFSEAKEALAKHGIEITRYDFKHNEIRSESIEEIALEAVRAAHTELKKPVFVEDTGLFIDALNGFPGTYSAWVTKKIGNEGILKLMEGQKNRKALFRTCIILKTPKEEKTFTAECHGKIAEQERGKMGFGFDSIFIPESHEQTFGESISLKKELSHRYKSLLALAKYLAENKIR